MMVLIAEILSSIVPKELKSYRYREREFYLASFLRETI
jgi:hypothetical protein